MTDTPINNGHDGSEKTPSKESSLNTRKAQVCMFAIMKFDVWNIKILFSIFSVISSLDGAGCFSLYWSILLSQCLCVANNHALLVRQAKIECKALRQPLFAVFTAATNSAINSVALRQRRIPPNPDKQSFVGSMWNSIFDYLSFLITYGFLLDID